MFHLYFFYPLLSAEVTTDISYNSKFIYLFNRSYFSADRDRLVAIKVNLRSCFEHSKQIVLDRKWPDLPDSSNKSVVQREYYSFAFLAIDWFTLFAFLARVLSRVLLLVDISLSRTGRPIERNRKVHVRKRIVERSRLYVADCRIEI